MTREEKILKGVQEHYKDFKVNYPSMEEVGIFLQGSQNYGLDYEGSDIDTKMIVLPSFEDIVQTNNPISKTHIRDNEEHIDIKDIRVILETIKKQNINFVEILFTKYMILNPKYEKLMKPLIENRERIARYDMYGALNCMVGMAIQKHKAMEHPYPTIVHKIEKYGYDCYHQDTEFLTRGGWKKYSEIKRGEEVGTLNPKTHELEFQTPLNYFCDDYSGKMYDIETINSHFIVTPNHNLYVSPININKNGHTYKENQSDWKLVKASDIVEGVKGKKISKHNHLAKIINKSKDLIEWENVKITDELLLLLGAWISDGTICFRDKKVKSIRITQKNINRKHNQDFINMMDSIKDYKISKFEADARNSIGTEITWDCHEEDIKKFYDWCGHKSETKRLPKFFTKLSHRQANLLLDSLCLGDGTQQTSRRVYYTINPLLADDVQLLSTIANKDSVVMGGEEGYKFYDKFSKSESYIFQVSIKEKEYSPDWSYLKKGKNVQEIDYNGKIVCFEVPNHILITRYNGKIATQGNCKQLHHIIRMREFIQRYVQGESYSKCLVSNQADYLIEVKKGLHTLGEARRIAETLVSETQAIKNTYMEHYNNTILTDVEELMVEAKMSMLRQYFKEELR